MIGPDELLSAISTCVQLRKVAELSRISGVPYATIMNGFSLGRQFRHGNAMRIYDGLVAIGILESDHQPVTENGDRQKDQVLSEA